jgi:DNA-binding NtrC family response regulator
MNAAAQDDPPQSESSRRPRPTLLVVEDEVLLRFAVCAFLRDAGYNVLEAATAEEAISILRSVAVDLLFVDVHLRGRRGDGIDVTQFAREYRPSIEVIMTSGKEPRDKARSALGPYRFLIKPYLFVRLLEAVSAALAEAEEERPQSEKPG